MLVVLPRKNPASHGADRPGDVPYGVVGRAKPKVLTVCRHGWLDFFFFIYTKTSQSKNI